MKGLIKKLLVALTGAILVGVVAIPTNVKAASICPNGCGGECSGWCSNYIGQVVNTCDGKKVKYKGCKAVTIDGHKYCYDLDWKYTKIGEKTDEQLAEEAKKTAEMVTAYNEYFAGNAAATNEIAALYAVNPGMGLDAQLTYLANINIDSFNAQYASFLQNNATDLALYEAMIQAQ